MSKPNITDRVLHELSKRGLYHQYIDIMEIITAEIAVGGRGEAVLDTPFERLLIDTRFRIDESGINI